VSLPWGSVLLALALTFGFEIRDQLRELVVLSVEVGQWEVESVRQPLLGLQVRLVDTFFVAVDSGARDEFVKAHLDA